MGECLHTSADGLSKLVKWAHSHGTICTLIPSLKHMLTEGAHGQLTALWGCGAGHAYHWPVTASCKTGLKDRMCFERSSRGISSETLMQGAAAMQSSLAQRFLGSTGKSSKGDTNQTRDSYDFSNCSEPSEMDDNTEEDNNHLFDIVCESSATDEEIDLEPRIMHRKRGTKGQNSEDSGDPGAKKIKQERAEDYYTVANAQNQAGIDSAQLSQSINSHIRSSASLSASNNPPLLEDGDLARTSSSPVDTSSHSKSVHTSIGRSENKTHMDSNPGASQHMAGLGQAGKSDLVEVLPNGDFGMNFEDPSGAVHPEIDILAEQQNSAEPGSDGTGYLEEQFWPSTSELCTNSESHSEERKQLEEFITSVDPGTLRSLQGVISRLLVFNEQSRAVVRSPPRPGEQELFPGSGLFLPPYKLACIHQESRQDSMRLFHLLFEHFFTEEDLVGAVAFGKRGKVPDGKKILDRRKVDGIISYVLRCSSLDGWTPVESAKLKKACINKCRLRIGQRKKLAKGPFHFHNLQKPGGSYM
ncbi:uncharacterized protein LOC134332389 isoform X3 [Trichomycterus rosablanca]|uniref:uncharacterized protein LOC134332389 isoform X3 n=1 Tax=Trichomycterus rosablanca TaxID=2290929 RepID=UPI002F3517CA